MRPYVLSVLVFLFAGNTQLLKAQNSIEGVWRTVDDGTGESKSNIKIFKENNKYYGRIITLLRPKADQNAKCKNCSGSYANQPILNMVILRDLELANGDYKNGHILDPENGKDYNCKAWLNKENPDELKLRGYVSVFYRTQTWYRVK